MVETFSGKRIAANMPILGGDVFTQTAGIHADGDKKGNLYVSRLTPDRFDRNRSYALGKLSGKASLEMNLEKLGINLNDDQKEKLLQKIVELGELKKNVTVEDLPFFQHGIFSGCYNAPALVIQILNNEVNNTAKHVVGNPHLSV